MLNEAIVKMTLEPIWSFKSSVSHAESIMDISSRERIGKCIVFNWNIKGLMGHCVKSIWQERGCHVFLHMVIQGPNVRERNSQPYILFASSFPPPHRILRRDSYLASVDTYVLWRTGPEGVPPQELWAGEVRGHVLLSMYSLVKLRWNALEYYIWF